MVKHFDGIVVDLDDTLYPQSSYLAAAALNVGKVAAELGLVEEDVVTAMNIELSKGSDKGGTIDRTLLRLGVATDLAKDMLPILVEAFLATKPETLPWYPGARSALMELAAKYPLAILTDGAPVVQLAKIAALQLEKIAPIIVITDELGGRNMRKPNPVGLIEAAKLLNVAPDALVMVGDRPGKDMAIAKSVGASSIRVRTGEYVSLPDDPPASWYADSFSAAAKLLLT